MHLERLSPLRPEVEVELDGARELDQVELSCAEPDEMGKPDCPGHLPGREKRGLQLGRERPEHEHDVSVGDVRLQKQLDSDPEIANGDLLPGGKPAVALLVQD